MDRCPALRQRLLDEMAEVRTVDCHSHTMLEREYYQTGGLDLFSLMSYFNRDIVTTAGENLFARATDDAGKWRLLKGVLEKSRNVTYWRHNMVVYRQLFGLEDADLSDDNWEAMNAAIREKSQDPAWYHHVTAELCSLETQVKNIPWFEDWEPQYFTAVLRMEGALNLHQKDAREGLEKHLDAAITDLKTAKEALRKLVEQYLKRGAVGIKLAHAYGRTLASFPVEEARGLEVLGRALRGQSLNAQEVKDLQDHIIFYLAELCRETGAVFQIHTGVQGNWGNIPDSDPLLLIPLLRAFPDVRFDLFHAGYPYSRMMGMLGKHYPNVWLNMAWMYVISMAASRQVLAEWIDLVPGYRMLAFGSDVGYPEMIYGHLQMARSCLADVLTAKVEQDFLSEEEAVSLARKMLRDNALELYGLPR